MLITCIAQEPTVYFLIRGSLFSLKGEFSYQNHKVYLPYSNLIFDEKGYIHKSDHKKYECLVSDYYLSTIKRFNEYVTPLESAYGYDTIHAFDIIAKVINEVAEYIAYDNTELEYPDDQQLDDMDGSYLLRYGKIFKIKIESEFLLNSNNKLYFPLRLSDIHRSSELIMNGKFVIERFKGRYSKRMIQNINNGKFVDLTHLSDRREIMDKINDSVNYATQYSITSDMMKRFENI